VQIKNILFFAPELCHLRFALARDGSLARGRTGQAKTEALHKLVQISNISNNCLGLGFFLNAGVAWETTVGAGERAIPFILISIH